jgi:hypothetical protein
MVYILHVCLQGKESTILRIDNFTCLQYIDNFTIQHFVYRQLEFRQKNVGNSLPDPRREKTSKEKLVLKYFCCLDSWEIFLQTKFDGLYLTQGGSSH